MMPMAWPLIGCLSLPRPDTGRALDPGGGPASLLGSLGQDAWMAFTDGWAHDFGPMWFGEEYQRTLMDSYAEQPLPLPKTAKLDIDRLWRFNYRNGGACDGGFNGGYNGKGDPGSCSNFTFACFWPRRDLCLGALSMVYDAPFCDTILQRQPEVQPWEGAELCTDPVQATRGQAVYCETPFIKSQAGAIGEMGQKLAGAIAGDGADNHCYVSAEMKSAALKHHLAEYYAAFDAHSVGGMLRPPDPSPLDKTVPWSMRARDQVGPMLRPLARLMAALVEMHPFKDGNDRTRALILQTELLRLGTNGAILYDLQKDTVLMMTHNLSLVEEYILQGWCAWERHNRLGISPFANLTDRGDDATRDELQRCARAASIAQARQSQPPRPAGPRAPSRAARCPRRTRHGSSGTERMPSRQLPTASPTSVTRAANRTTTPTATTRALPPRARARRPSTTRTRARARTSRARAATTRGAYQYCIAI